LDFDRRLAVEKEIDKQPEQLQQMSMDFEESNTIIIYTTFVGIKFYNLALRQVVRIIGK
jgi:peptidylprolyl isomerase domain and WD repeat-containing protein 1